MSFNVRPVTEDDVPEIVRWFDNRKWPLPPAHGVGAKIGIVAESNGVMYACIYTYITGTSVVYLEWCGLNPSVPVEQSSEALVSLIDSLKKMCEVSEPKVRVLSISTQSEFIAAQFKKCGFRLESDYYKATWMLKD
jgi:hypothetical protein